MFYPRHIFHTHITTVPTLPTRWTSLLPQSRLRRRPLLLPALSLVVNIRHDVTLTVMGWQVRNRPTPAVSGGGLVMFTARALGRRQKAPHYTIRFLQDVALDHVRWGRPLLQQSRSQRGVNLSPPK
jgi:hypothetical protein